MRVKIVFVRKMDLHGVEMLSKLIFAGYCVDAWDVVDALVEMHSNESLRMDGVVCPADIPVFVLRLVGNTHAQQLTHLPDNGVMGNFI